MIQELQRPAVDSQALDQIFLNARTYHQWSDQPVPESLIRQLYELFKWGPTSANSVPARFVWVRSPQGKERLASLAAEVNRPKILAAPLTVILGYDLDFPSTLPKLLPPSYVEPMQKMFRESGKLEETALRNSSLQGAYLIVAARALGLDCGPMSGFDNAGVDEAFFAGTTIRSNFICSLGYGVPGSPFPRSGRLSFEETSRFA